MIAGKSSSERSTRSMELEAGSVSQSLGIRMQGQSIHSMLNSSDTDFPQVICIFYTVCIMKPVLPPSQEAKEGDRAAHDDEPADPVEEVFPVDKVADAMYGRLLEVDREVMQVHAAPGQLVLQVWFDRHLKHYSRRRPQAPG